MPRMTYEPEANVLWLEMSNAPIDHAQEMGSVIVHFTKKNVPVAVEIVMNDFRKTNLYSTGFLKDLEAGLRRSSYIKRRGGHKT